MKNMWHPISPVELDAVISRDLRECDSETLTLFATIRIEPRKAEFARASVNDQIYIIAALGPKVIYYDDTEEGFEVGQLIGNQIQGGTGQFTLVQALRQIISGSR